MQQLINIDPIYHSYLNPDFKNNPVLQAIRPPPASETESLHRLIYKPDFVEHEKDMPAYERVFCPLRLSNFLFPSKMHVTVLNNAYIQILSSLAMRNPLAYHFKRAQYSSSGNRKISFTENFRPKNWPWRISFITGLSGLGKTATVNAVMRVLGETVIQHHSYLGEPFTETQITYLHVNVPSRCNARLVCKSFIEETDNLLGYKLYTETYSTSYEKPEVYLDQLKRIILNHHVGILIVDEFQNISLQKSGGKDELIAMLTNTAIELGVPVILVGTYKAARILDDESMALTRRLVNGGYYEFKAPKSFKEPVWKNFCQKTWQYQWVRDAVPFSDKICERLYEYSAGIYGIMIDLFIRSQTTAIWDEKEFVDINRLRMVYEEQMGPLHKLVKGLLDGDPIIFENYDDMYIDANKIMKNDSISSNYSNKIEETIQAIEAFSNGKSNPTHNCQNDPKMARSVGDKTEESIEFIKSDII